LILEGPFVAGHTYIAHQLGNSGRCKDVHAVRGQTKGSACFAGTIRCLEEVNAETCLLEQQGKYRTGDSCAGDKNASGSIHRSNPHSLIISIIEIMIR
jgi:hypothetical protein